MHSVESVIDPSGRRLAINVHGRQGAARKSPFPLLRPGPTNALAAEVGAASACSHYSYLADGLGVALNLNQNFGGQKLLLLTKTPQHQKISRTSLCSASFLHFIISRLSFRNKTDSPGFRTRHRKSFQARFCLSFSTTPSPPLF